MDENELEYEEKPQRDMMAEMLADLTNTKQKTKLEEYPITMINPEGEEAIFTIRAMDGFKRNEYIEFQAAQVKYKGDGSVGGMKSTKDFENKLVSLVLVCPDGKFASLEFVRSLPGTLLRKLAKVGAHISGLDKESEERAKNS